MFNKFLVSLKQWWAYQGMSEDERYLSRAVDHADLKNRMIFLEERRNLQSRLYFYNCTYGR